MKIEYNKLVRDKIPEIIHQTGKKYQIEVMREDEFKLALLEKLVEEANEARLASPDKLIIELADLSEVIDAIVKTFDLSGEQLLFIKEKRLEERGGFEDRLKLIWTDPITD